ncbi:hypothetical protein Q8A67_021922 [Cirrhinus molitorella]|uniref:Uncharacterized protein n=1 Tax=Cirrhinus molitorella TaxID=172907 RepID=A0AA88P4F3_9TELE|nr:hypothetical protein Q8A67_021922 [Cirrhinus molitorella]
MNTLLSRYRLSASAIKNSAECYLELHANGSADGLGPQRDLESVTVVIIFFILRSSPDRLLISSLSRLATLHSISPMAHPSPPSAEWRAKPGVINARKMAGLAA